MIILEFIWALYQLCSVAFTTLFLWGLFKTLTNRKEREQLLREYRGQSDNDETETVTKIKLLYVESFNGVWFVYDKLTNQFVAQATSEVEALERAKSLFPKHNILVADDKNLLTKLPN